MINKLKFYVFMILSNRRLTSVFVGMILFLIISKLFDTDVTNVEVILTGFIFSWIGEGYNPYNNNKDQQ